MIYDVSNKSLIGPKLLRISFDKWMDLLEFMMGLDICHQLALKNMMPLTRGVDTLLVKIVVLHMLFLIAMQKLKWVHMTLHL